jgi:hypothetical protein
MYVENPLHQKTNPVNLKIHPTTLFGIFSKIFQPTVFRHRKTFWDFGIGGWSIFCKSMGMVTGMLYIWVGYDT